MIAKKRQQEIADFLKLELSEIQKMDKAVQELPGYAKWINVAIKDWEETNVNQKIRNQIEDWFKKNDKYLFELNDVHSRRAKQKVVRQLVNLCKKYEVKKYLDYGGGIGEEVIKVAKVGINASMADLPTQTFDFAKWRAEKNGLKINFIEILNENALKENYDAISCFEVLQHTFHPEKVGKHFVDHLNQNGILILTTRFNNPHYPMALLKNYQYQEGMVDFFQSLYLELVEKIYQYGEGERAKFVYVFKKEK